jgi:1-deoxy-D-xylulose-5-phosphate reductoisomerase
MAEVKPQGVALLGATGSIGASSLDVIARHPDRFRVVALTAHGHAAALAELCRRFVPEVAVVADPEALPTLERELRTRGLPTQALGGGAALEAAACWPSADTVIAAIVGAAGLTATLAAARAGKRLLIANKEAIVCAGTLLQEAVQAGGATVLPVDSEHSAIHQCLTASGAQGGAARLILTASGGPFRQRNDFDGITPAQAVAHPNWVMGRKISVDSATLMNKGLEVIEANWLFGFAAEAIDVVVHPQSVIHSMVEFNDGSVLAQLGSADMRTPIAYALGFPERIDSGSTRLDFMRLGALTFEPPDLRRFPCLQLAYDALRAAGAASIVLNAANEVAVASFLDGVLPFARIATVIEQVLAALSLPAPQSVAELLDIDDRARRQTAVQIEQMTARSAA